MKLGAGHQQHPGPESQDNQHRLNQGRNRIRPLPLPNFLARRHFSGRGRVYILKLPAAGVCTPSPRPFFIHPPSQEGCFTRGGGGEVGVIKFGHP